MAGLDLIDISKTYGGGVLAVENASFAIADGEFIVLVGPSGCGKSTLLRMIAGLESVTEGEIRIDGERVNEVEPGDRDIAMVFQNYALYPHMSVYNNMAYGLKNQGMSRDRIRERIDEAAKTLQLTEYLQRRPRQLSGGQRQRVAMGRAIVREPRAFLLDEPLSNLDAKLRTHMRSQLKEMHRRLNATFVYVTHDQVEAMSLADRIVILNDGRIEQIGTPLEVYRDPRTQFVAGFIGSPAMNFFPTVLVDGADGMAPRPDGAAALGVRPEHAEICSADAALLSGDVIYSEILGSETLIHFAVEGADAFAVKTTDPSHAPQPGERLGVRWSPEHMMVFDAGGQRMEWG